MFLSILSTHINRSWALYLYTNQNTKIQTFFKCEGGWRLAAATGGWRLVGDWWLVAFLDLLDVEFNIQHRSHGFHLETLSIAVLNFSNLKPIARLVLLDLIFTPNQDEEAKVNWDANGDNTGREGERKHFVFPMYLFPQFLYQHQITSATVLAMVANTVH